MLHSIIRLLVLATGILALAPTPQAQEVTSPDQQDAMREMEPTVRIYEHVIHSEILGRDVRLLVWKPDQAAPESGYPAIYSFDGETSITLFSEMSAQMEGLGKRYGLVAPLIVGFAEMPGARSMDGRTYDYTPFAESYDLHERPNGLAWPELGGGDKYLDAVIDEFKPFIATHYAIDRTRETLFGHSLAGVMTLHSLATRPDAFDAYVAVSPSLWFDTARRFEEISAWLADPAFAPKHPVPLILTVGSMESGLMPWDDYLSEAARAKRLVWKKRNAMVENAEAMAALIAEKGAAKIELDFALLAGENHHSAKPITMNRAIMLSMTPDQDQDQN